MAKKSNKIKPTVWKNEQMSPIVWNAPKIKDASKIKYKKGKLTFFSISNPEGDLDMLLSKKMFKYRKLAAQILYKKAKQNYKKAYDKLAQVGVKKRSSKRIEELEKCLITAKLLKEQTKIFYRLAKADFKKYKQRAK